jgi:hypothetical protein
VRMQVPGRCEGDLEVIGEDTKEEEMLRSKGEMESSQV